MKKRLFHLLTILTLMAISCNQAEQNKATAGNDSAITAGKDSATTAGSDPGAPAMGSFSYDLQFLRQHDSVVVLKNDSGHAQVIVSPKYQAKVFTSTAEGESGKSFGWVNYKAFSGPVDPHMNGYGGENRFWLGPEGGKFSLFFKPGAQQVFANWKTPAAVDTESWDVTDKTEKSISMKKVMQLENYKGTKLDISVGRRISILGDGDVEKSTGMSLPEGVKVVAYMTDNKITNTGTSEWNEQTGSPCIWILDMFRPGDETVIVVPFKKTDSAGFKKVVTSDYFGAIPADRLKHTEERLFFKADGKSRGKLGVAPSHAPTALGSYDAKNKVLTVVTYELDRAAKYLGQRWNTTDPPFKGDAVNVYNDGPLENGTQMGPFYELESVSPAAFLKPGGSLSHHQSVYHFTGDEKGLDMIALHLLGVSLSEIKKAF
ncbi:MAG TPA: DUF6786 family protein [Puia sp.]|nr:DUF6786 family protein [Puia sp.]